MFQQKNQKILFYKLLSSFKIMVAIKDVNIELLNLNISASRQNIKKLIGNFGDIYAC